MYISTSFKIKYMKKLLLLFTLALVTTVSFAQSYSAKQITEMSKAFMTAGDTVGIYSYNTAIPQPMESIKYTGMKTNALGSALSYGLAKTKLKLEFADITSPYTFSGSAHFRFYFGVVPSSKVQRLYMFSSNYTIRDFAVSQFAVKKNKRQLTQGSFSLFGGSKSGLETDQSVKITSSVIRDGVYDVTVTAQPGEYCFVFTNNGAGGYNSVFDFTIK